jgi:hypothetical protein
LQAGVKWGFSTFGQYLDKMRGNLGVNVASLVGHCALRQYVMGEASLQRAATAAEIHQMKEVLKASVRAGAAGFSTNQNPVHMYADGTPIQSRFATDEEIVELASALGEINQGTVQISRGSLGVSVPIGPSVKLFEEISAARADRWSGRASRTGGRGPTSGASCWTWPRRPSTAACSLIRCATRACSTTG